MCGIWGRLEKSGRRKIDPARCYEITQLLKHRGPDEEGQFHSDGVYLGHRRLRVIDLAQGKQPMRDASGRYRVVYNGEIYNYRELRAEIEAAGRSLRTNSDTEVLVEAYSLWGGDCLKKFNGMWAFCIYDEREKTFFLARDRLGIKPLYYYDCADTFIFGSELKTVIANGDVPKRIDPLAVRDFLSCNYIPQPRTIIENVMQVPPGAFVRVEGGRVELRRYWDIPPAAYTTEPEGYYVERIRELLKRSVKRRLIADVPVGAFLSGGMDSSTLCAVAAAEKGTKLKTFSVGFKSKRYDETPAARVVAEHLGTDHYEIECEAADVPGLLPRIAWLSDNLLSDQAMLPLYKVSELAKRHVVVALDGDGGDEVFVGYITNSANRMRQKFMMIPRPIRKHLIEPALRKLPASTSKLSFDYKVKKFLEGYDFSPQKAHYWWRTVFSDDEKRGVVTREFLERIDTLDGYGAYGKYFARWSGAPFLEQTYYADLKVWTVDDALMKVDTMTMAHGLETRVPLLDHELVEFMTTVPGDVKFRRGKLKYLMKKVMSDSLPREIIRKKKAGWHIPIAEWFRDELKNYVRETLMDSGIFETGFFKRDAILKIADDHIEGKCNNSFKLWGLMLFSHWYEQFMKRAALS
ncbi:MAG: asparagine synthase (glutamine-hydrolyzing) [bacterium]